MTGQIPDKTVDKIHPTQISEWVKHPITKEYLQLVNKHLEGNKGTLQGLILNNAAQQLKETLPLLLQLKGQIHTLEVLSDLKEFMSELTEEVIPDEL